MTPPDKQEAAETLEATAHRLTAQFYDHDRLPTRFAAYRSILSCLRNERERCTKIAADAYHRLDLLNAEGAEPMRMVLSAIREGSEL